MTNDQKRDPAPSTGAGAPGNLDAMPHVHRRASDGALTDDLGNVIPPAQQSGRAGTDDITWEAGLPHRAPGGDEENR